MLNINEIKQKLFKAFNECSFYDDIKNNISLEINSETSFFNDLNIESIQLLEFIIHVENALGKSLDFEKLSIENFDTIEKLSQSLYVIGV